MKKHCFLTLLILTILCSTCCLAQSPQFPIIKNFGGIYEIPEAKERPDPNAEYKIMIDLASAAENPEKVNRMVDNIARMINLHGLAGIPKNKIKVKVAVHGGAIFSILKDEAYEKMYGVKNPNLPVYKTLTDAGVEIYICGQSLLARNIATSDVWGGSILALSMLTTVTTYVPQGYVLLKF